MCKEIELINQKIGKIKINSIHIGGGTPTTLTEQEFDILFKTLHNNFSIRSDLEITCESSPETVSKSKIKYLKSLGINRLNIGVESLDDTILKSINRRHNAKEAIRAIDNANLAGINNINIDLIYGLPNETIENWEKTLSQAVEFNVQSISTYRLRIHPYGSLKKEKNINSEYEFIKKYVNTLSIMKSSNYIQAASHKFARKEEFVQKQIINKRGVKNNDLISLGLSSYGYINNTLYWNEREIGKYTKLVNSGILPVSLGYELSEIEQITKICVLGLHNLKGINLKDLRDRYQVEIVNIYPKIIDFLLKYDLALIDNDHFHLTDLGMIFADEIALQFYSEDVRQKLINKNLRYGIFFDEILF